MFAAAAKSIQIKVSGDDAGNENVSNSLPLAKDTVAYTKCSYRIHSHRLLYSEQQRESFLTVAQLLERLPLQEPQRLQTQVHKTRCLA